MLKIIVDSREQQLLWTNDIIVKKLDVGDYSIEGHEHSFAIERKGLPDLFSTLGKGNRRFKRELERAKSYSYFAIIIEGTYTQVEDKFFPGAEYSQMKGDVVNKILNTLMVKYGIHVIYAQNREEARKMVIGLMEAYLRVHTKLYIE